MKHGSHPYKIHNLSGKKHITLDIVTKIIKSKSIKCLLALLQYGWDVNTSFVYCTKNSGTMSVMALHLAVEKNWCEGVTALVEAGAVVDVATVPVEIGINGGVCVSRKWFMPMYTPLMSAAEQGCICCLETLIKAKADISFRENVTQTSALRLALFRGHIVCVMALLRAEADVNIIGEPLYFPVSSSGTSFYSYCPCSILITAIRHFNGTIHINALTSPEPKERVERDDWLNIIKAMLNHNCDVNYSGSHLETTPLIESIENKDTRVVELLLQHGALTKVKSHVKLQMSPQVSTALDLACFSNNLSAAQLLIEYGADIHDIAEDLFEYILENKFLDITALLILAGYRIPEFLQNAIKSSSPDIKNMDSFTCLLMSPWALKAICRKSLRLKGNFTDRAKLIETGLPVRLQNYVLCKLMY